MKHTPGPYTKVSRDDYWNGWTIRAARGTTIATIHLLGKKPNEEAEATADLFTAAPELLEALIELLEVGQQPFSYDVVDGLNALGHARERARAAIAKATGETP